MCGRTHILKFYAWAILEHFECKTFDKIKNRSHQKIDKMKISQKRKIIINQ